MKPSLESILHEAVNFESKAFDDDEDINGAHLVEWFAQWRRRARAIVRTNRTTEITPAREPGVSTRLISALHALQLRLGRGRRTSTSPTRSTTVAST